MTAEAMRNHVHKLVQPTDSEWEGVYVKFKRRDLAKDEFFYKKVMCTAS